MPNYICETVSNYSIVLVVRNNKDIDEKAWWLLSHKHGYRSIDVGDVPDSPVNDEMNKKNSVSLYFKVGIDDSNEKIELEQKLRNALGMSERLRKKVKRLVS